MFESEANFSAKVGVKALLEKLSTYEPQMNAFKGINDVRYHFVIKFPTALHKTE